MVKLLNNFWIKCKLVCLNTIHFYEWYKLERKYITITAKGEKNYSNWPRCFKATPEWKARVKRVQKMCDLAKGIK